MSDNILLLCFDCTEDFKCFIMAIARYLHFCDNDEGP